MKVLRSKARWLLLLALALAGLGLSGCATTNDEVSNESVRPWNSPKNWEGGLPSSMFEGR